MTAIEKLEAKIEERRALLKWINSRKNDTDTGSIENFLCLCRILSDAKWVQAKDGYWHRPDKEYPQFRTMPAARIVTQELLDQDIKTLLEKTTGQQ